MVGPTLPVGLFSGLGGGLVGGLVVPKKLPKLFGLLATGGFVDGETTGMVTTGFGSGFTSILGYTFAPPKKLVKSGWLMGGGFVLGVVFVGGVWMGAGEGSFFTGIGMVGGGLLTGTSTGLSAGFG